MKSFNNDVSCFAWGHPLSNSAVVLKINRDSIEAKLTLPLGELAAAWEELLPLDAAATVEIYGEKLKDEVRAELACGNLSLF